MFTGPLVSAAKLDRLRRHPQASPAILDVRWELGAGPLGDDYLAGHVPGAVFVDLDAVLAAPPGQGGRHPLPALADFQAGMRAAGVGNARPVVLYDAGNSMAAARGWWLLRYFGHPDVAVLDGGLAAWTGAGLPVETGDAGAPARASDFDARPGGMPVLDADAAAGLAARGGALLDARAPERFRGESEPVDAVAGHIPGARNRPTALNLAPGGQFLDAAALREAFASVGVDGEAEVGAYCGSGISAAHQVLALELAGYTAALYPGSWSEWIRDPARPVAAGPA
jgi:thiosulfate/3-mercaptopyruvate sulfurtransferase